MSSISNKMFEIQLSSELFRMLSEPTRAEILKLLAAAPPSSAKSAAPAAAPKPEKPKRELTEEVKAWNALVEKTVEEMRTGGWESWTDLHDKVWAASVKTTITEKDGTTREAFVFEDTKKEPSLREGGLARASWLKVKDDPEALAAAKAKKAAEAAKKAEKAAAESDSGSATGSKGKGGRKKMTDEEKAAAKAEREEKLAAMSEEEKAELEAKKKARVEKAKATREANKAAKESAAESGSE